MKEKEYRVTIVKEGSLYSIEVDDIETSETVKIYENVYETFSRADRFVKDYVEAEFNIVSYRAKI